MITRRLTALGFLCLFVATAAFAQPVAMTATASTDALRVTSSPGTVEMRIEVISSSGSILYDSEWQSGNVFDWTMPLIPYGSYALLIHSRDLEGRVVEKRTALHVTPNRITVDSIASNELKLTTTAHDGETGQLITTSGDLSFRFGDFLNRKDTEAMRLTAEGKLGIGTDNPQATLDVVGSIRASQGLEFSDGTVQTSGLSGRVDAEGNIMPMVAGTGTVNQVAKWLETGGAGTLGNSTINESGGAVTIGTVASRGQLQIAGGATADVFAGMGPDLINGPAFNYGYAGFTFGLGAGFFNVRPAAGATGVNPSLRFMTINQERMIVTNTGNVGIGTSTPAVKLDVAGTVALSGNLTLPASSSTAGNILQGGSRLLHTFGSDNVFLGRNAGNFTMTTGIRNTASGVSALQSNTTGTSNTASGISALFSNTTGNNNTAIGDNALFSNTTGGGNIAVGVNAGVLITTGINNIHIANSGIGGDSATIRIGNPGTQTQAFLAGVSGVTSASGVQVFINTSGQLGTTTSSAGVKRDIAGLGEQSSALMKLRPVSFFYRSDAAGIRQYGLIAEEVAEVMPELVQFTPEGEAQTVRYHFLAPLLLSEIQKQQQTIEEQRLTNDQQRQMIEQQRKQITMIEARLATLEEQSRHTANLKESVAVQQRITQPSGRATE